MSDGTFPDVSAHLTTCETASVILRHLDTVNPLYTDIRYNDKIHYNDNLNVTKSSLKG